MEYIEQHKFLAAAIITEAIQDYRESLAICHKGLEHCKTSSQKSAYYQAEKELAITERFFRSNRFVIIIDSLFGSQAKAMSGDELIDLIQKQELEKLNSKEQDKIKQQEAEDNIFAQYLVR